MAISIQPINPAISFPNDTPGQTVTRTVTLENAVQPTNTVVPTTIIAEFNGETATRANPVTIQAPPAQASFSVTVDVPGAAVDATISNVRSVAGGFWQADLTVTTL